MPVQPPDRRPGQAPDRMRGRLQGEERARLGERRAQRRCNRAVADEVEQVAVRPGRCIRPLARYAGTVETDEQRPPAGAVEIAAIQ